MKKTLYLILISAILAFGLVFSLGANGQQLMSNHHGSGLMLPCFGSDCGTLLPELACSAHCLTSGLMPTSSLYSGQVVVPYLFLLFAVTVVAVALLAIPRPILSGFLTSPPSAGEVRVKVKLE